MAMPEEKRPLKIAVVGGSLAGLFAGVALKQAGHNCVIFERSPDPVLKGQGAGIGVGGDFLEFFERYNRCPRPFSVPSCQRHFLDQDGGIVATVVHNAQSTSWGLIYSILRTNFDGLETPYCDVPENRSSDGRAEYKYGCEVTGLDDEGERGIRLWYKDTRHGDETKDSMLADYVIGADGVGSRVRDIMCPNITRQYSGYCALRGTVPETMLSKSAQDVIAGCTSFFHGPGNQFVVYLIPGPDGATAPGHRLANAVWYTNFPADSAEYAELMTGNDNKRHAFTISAGNMRPQIWAAQVEKARKILPPQFSEVVEKATAQFASAVMDVIALKPIFMDGKVILVGDALAALRPHVNTSTSQAAYHAMLLTGLIDGKLDQRSYILEVMRYARLLQQRAVQLGTKSQFGKDIPYEEHITDKSKTPRPRDIETFPEWTQEGL